MYMYSVKGFLSLIISDSEAGTIDRAAGTNHMQMQAAICLQGDYYDLFGCCDATRKNCHYRRKVQATRMACMWVELDAQVCALWPFGLFL